MALRGTRWSSTTYDLTDITVNLDGLWLLQALLGIAGLAPELRGRPYGQPRSTEWLTAHPGLGVLVEQGICDDAGVVRSDIAARMAVLAAPDVEVVVLVFERADERRDAGSDGGSGPPGGRYRMSSCELCWRAADGRWASAARAGSYITIDDCGGVDQVAARAAGASRPWTRFIVWTPARISAVNVPLDDMLSAVREHAQAGTVAAKRAALRAVGLRGAVLAELGAALEEPVAEAVMYARAYADADTAWSESVLNLRDTASGRVALYRLSPPRGSQPGVDDDRPRHARADTSRGDNGARQCGRCGRGTTMNGCRDKCPVCGHQSGGLRCQQIVFSESIGDRGIARIPVLGSVAVSRTQGQGNDR